jgi:hypothetical protein
LPAYPARAAKIPRLAVAHPVFLSLLTILAPDLPGLSPAGATESVMKRWPASFLKVARRTAAVIAAETPALDKAQAGGAFVPDRFCGNLSEF